MSEWLARRVAPDGTAMAVDLDLSLVEADVPSLELRRGDIVAGPVAPGDFDLVTARTVLHHVADARIAVENLVASAYAELGLDGIAASPSVNAFLARCADRTWWTQAIAFTAVHARTPGS